MLNSQKVINKLLSQYVEPDVLEAMKQILNTESSVQNIKGARIIAEVFGATKYFDILIGKPSVARDEYEKKLVHSFYNNLKLLLQKTWVEKSDEALKEQLLYQLDATSLALQNKKYAEIYESFLLLLHDVVYLLFGAQSKKEEFAEYALRIDPDFGVFWWFLQSVPAKIPAIRETGRLYILLGMFFLANY